MFYNGRCVAIESLHGGIEPSIISDYLMKPSIIQRVKELRKEFGNRFVFVGIDKVCNKEKRSLKELRKAVVRRGNEVSSNFLLKRADMMSCVAGRREDI